MNRKAIGAVGILLVVVLAIVGINFLPQAINTLAGFGSSLTGLFSVAVPQSAPSSSTCPNSNGVGTLNYVIKAVGNSSLYYPAANYVVLYTSPDEKSGQVVETAAITAAGTLTYDRDVDTIECLSGVEVITLAGSNLTGSRDVVNEKVGTNVYKEVLVPTTSPIKLFARTSALANDTQLVDGGASAVAGGYEITTTTHAMTTGDRLDAVVEFFPVANKIHGNYQRNELIIAFDADTSKFSKTNGVTISGLPGIVSLPSSTYGLDSAIGADFVFKIPAIAAGNVIGFPGLVGSQKLTVTLNSDVGNPTADVTMYVLQPGWYQDTDGEYKYGIYNSVSTLQTVGTNTVVFDLS